MVTRPEMVEILEGRALSKHLLENYSRNPNGWSFTLFPSAKEDSGFFGAIVGSHTETWQLKLDSIFKSNPLMLGAKVESTERASFRQGNLSYGYRRLDATVAFELLRRLAKAELGDQDNSQMKLELERILGRIKPVVPVSGESYAQGPFILSDRKSLGITSEQKQLEDRLSVELRKLLRHRYLSYG